MKPNMYTSLFGLHIEYIKKMVKKMIKTMANINICM